MIGAARVGTATFNAGHVYISAPGRLDTFVSVQGKFIGQMYTQPKPLLSTQLSLTNQKYATREIKFFVWVVRQPKPHPSGCANT